MDADTGMHLLAQMLLTAAKVSAPILLGTLLVGLLVSVFQVVTQIQEMTLTFIPKLILVVALFLLLGSWMMAVVVEFARQVIGMAGGMGSA
ncbi:flagellar biosynthetic protein FliQ [Dyella sp. SG562]|uniref:flagellar biosynthetic protein FliQ n=1 Tax=Dyella TaxID=231454 RepID=UPI0014207243|nr:MULTISPECIES: flagellar biosynthetic protein FliQ [unclassified Dyella]NII74877.1 flagellar biosynthetic protein FliQ [Dyella sp. SG562]NKJ20366.1 flagellar biosynthetic protein FliQ [Dyella sp. SG609]